MFFGDNQCTLRTVKVFNECGFQTSKRGVQWLTKKEMLKNRKHEVSEMAILRINFIIEILLLFINSRVSIIDRGSIHSNLKCHHLLCYTIKDQINEDDFNLRVQFCEIIRTCVVNR